MPAKCPKCNSSSTESYNYENVKVLKCNDCGFDEGYNQQFPEEKTNQKEKGRYSPYKTGGKQRTRK